MINKCRDFVLEKLKLPFIRYAIMAGFVVMVELGTFLALNSGLKLAYQLATPTSAVVGIALNWYLSRKYVFKQSRHKLHREAGLIISTSLVGIGIQTGVASICVGILGLLPFIGKVLAIVATFFWSFWVRKRFIFTS